jgi:hypothetical protein
MFDYLTPNIYNDLEAGKRQHKWTSTDEEGRIGGGRPATLEKLAEQPDGEKIVDFRQFLFYRFEGIDGINSPEQQNLFLAGVLRDLNSPTRLVS